MVIDAETINLNLETAHSCGLIINELVTNALEHAFDGREKGIIWLNLQRQANANIVLSIRDDGVGLAQDFDFHQTNSLGLRLVRLLTRQLEGEVEVDITQSTCFKFTFSELNYSDRL